RRKVLEEGYLGWWRRFRQAQLADLRGVEVRDAPVLGRIHPEEARLQDLQRVTVRYQQDVAAGVPPLQVRDQRGRPVEHVGRGLDAVAAVVAVRTVRGPDPRVVRHRCPLQVAEAPLAQRLGEGDLRRAEVLAHDLRLCL